MKAFLTETLPQLGWGKSGAEEVVLDIGCGPGGITLANSAASLSTIQKGIRCRYIVRHDSQRPIIPIRRLNTVSLTSKHGTKIIYFGNLNQLFCKILNILYFFLLLTKWSSPYDLFLFVSQKWNAPSSEF
ncbi:hypothetical protein CEXT_499031 [Caerostris extrusa]|uniref:Uncharacterized protein n=1 Tax=Caerostris extrusa TaxID=172846 RepID=A0AAV4TG60_CAEEX|nr:hypothetical protein CEXT_499031 [Caerostris extrusa]